MTQELDYALPETILSESVFVSFHKRTPSQMASAHKDALAKKGHKVLDHETPSNGNHIIHYHSSSSNKIRTTTISPLKRKGGIVTKVDNRPALQSTKDKFSSKK